MEGTLMGIAYPEREKDSDSCRSDTYAPEMDQKLERHGKVSL